MNWKIREEKTMSEEATTTEKTDGASQPKVDELIKQAVEKAKEEILKKAEDQRPVDSGVTKDDLKKALEDQASSLRKTIAKEIAGDPDESQINPIIAKLANDPDGFVLTLLDLAEQRVEKRFEGKAEKARERKDAYDEVLSDRLDVTASKIGRELFQSLYKATSEEKSESERFKEALTKYDLLLEEQGAGKAEDRINAAIGLSSSSSKQGTVETDKKTDADFIKEEREQQIKEFKASRNRFV
jgi:Asp-tRNA(Asn)/Glu-tRNA(Gln) amidotransferase A subunit family amidase